MVLGLGNPGARYARTRHNVGWWLLETLVARWRAAEAPAPAPASVRAWRADPQGREVWLLAPQTYMNLSGEALAAWRRARPFETSELLVVGDDVYLPAGMLRLRAGGSSGGHRGLESVEAALGTRDYARLRIGVGHANAASLREHVLEEFTSDDERAVREAVVKAAEAVETWLADGLRAAMNRFNRRIAREVSDT